MSSTALRNKLKKAVQTLPEDKLLSVADFVSYIGNDTAELDKALKIARMQRRIAKAEDDFALGRGVSWRRVRRNV